MANVDGSKLISPEEKGLAHRVCLSEQVLRVQSEVCEWVKIFWYPVVILTVDPPELNGIGEGFVNGKLVKEFEQSTVPAPCHS